MTNLTTITAKPAPQETQSCWSCGTMRAVHFCEACGKVQPPAPVDYFTFFGLPRKLNLDVAALDKDFYELSRKLHPDLNAQRRQPGAGVEPATKFPAQRCVPHVERSDQAHQYLLKLEGVELEEQSKTATEQARSTGEAKKADRSARFAGRSFRAEHAARRAAHAEENGRGRSRPDRRNRPAETGIGRKAGSASAENWKAAGRCGME
jgi:hypothetical protein